MTGYWKTGLAIIGAVLVVLQAALDPIGPAGPGVSVDEAVTIADAILTAVLVYIVPNLQTGAAQFAKSLIAGAFAVTSSLVLWLVGGMSPSDWVLLVLAFGTAAGVFMPSAPKHPA